MLQLLLLGLLYHGTQAAIASHEITTLPGWNGTLPSKQYSGLLEIPGSNPARYYHYWLVLSENDPTNDPFVVWFNGGPGASSLLGYFTEQGPFNLNDNSVLVNTTEVPTLFYNEYTWAKASNIMFLESPAGVGFSYCNGSDPINSCPNWNDTNVAQDNLVVLQQFFKNYPEYLTNDFWITGESYAGIYVPTLLMQIEANPSGLPPVKGIMVGDGCMGIDAMGGCALDDENTFTNFMYGHGQISNEMYNSIQEICGNEIIYGNISTKCSEILNERDQALGGYNVYNIYDECYLENDELESLSKPMKFRNKNGHVRFNLEAAFNGAQKHHTSKYKNKNKNLGEGINQYACGGSRVTSIYLNLQQVQDAIHVANIPWTWQDGDWDKYTSTQHDLRPYYYQWAQKYRILIYYGDVDSAVPYNGGEEWTSQLGYSILEAWRPWTTDGKTLMGGYVQIYDTPYNFTFLTVRGAGHEVPQFKPEEALVMFQLFLHDEYYPPYTGTN